MKQYAINASAMLNASLPLQFRQILRKKNYSGELH